MRTGKCSKCGQELTRKTAKYKDTKLFCKGCFEEAKYESTSNLKEGRFWDQFKNNGRTQANVINR